MRPAGLRFDQPLRSDEYAWWYIDGLSSGGTFGITLIVFLGSVFSPYYSRSRQRGNGDPLNHCAVNVALYGSGLNRWSMTERGGRQVHRSEDCLSIGRSAMHWTGTALEINVDERCAPWPRRVRGSIRVSPDAVSDRHVAIDAGHRHIWSPLAPCARIDVELKEPALRWSGSGYIDANTGAEPLENRFARWTWSRAEVSDGSVVLYDIHERSETARTIALHFHRNGEMTRMVPPAIHVLPRTKWRIERPTRADSSSGVKIINTLEDGPFYSRTLLKTHLLGEHVLAIHESLDLNRFRSPWVQQLLPFRMPRIPW